MTELQEKIIELRKQNNGYKYIAKKVGCSYSTVKETCIKNNLGGIKGTKCVPKSQEEWKYIFERLHPAYIFIYNEHGIEGYNIIQCRYCGAIFKYTAQSMKPSHSINHFIICKQCEELIRQISKRKELQRQIKYKQSLIFRKGKRGKQLSMAECKECKQLFVQAHRKMIYCSKRCQEAKEHKDNSRYRYKIDLMILYKRDNGLCHICGEKCDWSDLSVNNEGYTIYGNRYPTRDHIKPKSLGGEHTYENIKLAHLWCNSKKGNSFD